MRVYFLAAVMLSARFSMDTFFLKGLSRNNSLFDNICMCGNPHKNAWSNCRDCAFKVSLEKIYGGFNGSRT